MFVIADLEWIEVNIRNSCPTQLAAIRVDEYWNETDRFYELILPKNVDFYEWDHVAFVGGKPIEFLRAKSAKDVFTAFIEWLNEDDILLWWHVSSDNKFRGYCKYYVNYKIKTQAISINKYVYAYLQFENEKLGNAYNIAEVYGIDINKELQHCAINDVIITKELLRKINYPQHKMLLPVDTGEENKFLGIEDHACTYQYDPDKNIIHARECTQLNLDTTKTYGFSNLLIAIKQGYKICACCKADYRKVRREKTADTINRSQYTYVYTPNSNVFHKSTCHLILNSKNIHGSKTYSSIEKSGRSPCKVCNPLWSDELKNCLVTEKKDRERQNEYPGISKVERKALLRHKTALQDRKEKLKNRKTSRSDIYTLTQPRFAFWAGQGYETFHVQSCAKLNGLKNLRGFSTYKEATKAGLLPCRKCKPSPKKDVFVCIPIDSKKRPNDGIAALEEQCSNVGYIYQCDDCYFYIETSVGKWKIEIFSYPIKLEHINLMYSADETNYHKQPRTFLSFSDTFNYIKRHDDNIIESKTTK